MSWLFTKKEEPKLREDLIESAFQTYDDDETERFQPAQSIKIGRPSAAIDDTDRQNYGFGSGNADSQSRDKILSPSHHQWDSRSKFRDSLELEVEMTESECLLRIDSLQKEIEVLKLDIDRRHDELRSLGDLEEPVIFTKELVGGNRWAIEGMAAPRCTQTMIDCGENGDTEVFIRDCHGDIQFGSVIPVKIKVEGRCRRICVSRCTHLYLAMESCSLESLITKCENITVVCGGHPPKITVEDTHGVNISLCFQLMIESLVQLRCSNIVINACDRQGIP